MQYGLTSVTFRTLSAEDTIALAVKAGLTAIEWGGDVHCPPKNIEAARNIARLTREAGLAVSSYGSYYTLGEAEQAYTYDDVLDTAEALGAGIVRIWAGHLPSAKVCDAQFARLVSEAKRLADLSQRRGIIMAFEYHGNSLTDSAENACRLMRAIHHPFCRLYWQANFERSVEENLRDIDIVRNDVVCAHVFAWKSNTEQLPLLEKEREWNAFYRRLEKGAEIPYLIEFVKDGAPEQFLSDCTALKKILEIE
ncbi:MAG: TIM barrel protein [Ruthenibacterium sp.]